jgi:hypothetical protein
VLWWAHAPILRGLGSYLTVDEPAESAQFMVVPPIPNVEDFAAKWYHENTSRRLLAIEAAPERAERLGITEELPDRLRTVMEPRGVSRDAVLSVPGGGRMYWEELGQLEPWLEQHPDAHVLVLTDPHDGRRTRYILDRQLSPAFRPRVAVHSMPGSEAQEVNWWKCRHGIKSVMYGWLKLIYVWLQDGGEPPPEPWNPDDYEREIRTVTGTGT